MQFSFSAPRQILFGSGVAAQLPDLSAALGRRPFVVTGAHPERLADVLGPLLDAPGGRVEGEPTVDDVRALTEQARESGAEIVVGVGGGSVIDAAKAVAMLVANGTDPLDHAEVIGEGRPITVPSLPVIAVPTTAGTGSEATANAVVLSPEHGVKVSLRSVTMIPTVALVDPALTLTCPPRTTADSGLDAFTQCLEPFVSWAAGPMTDALAVEGLHRGEALRRAYEDGSDLAAREEMSLMSLYGGLCLANAKLGAVHGFAGVLGAMTGAAHGAICGALLQPVIEVNIEALRTRDVANPALERYRQAAVAVTGRLDAQPGDLLAWISETLGLLGVPGLRRLGLDPSVHAEVVQKASAASSMKGNPILLTETELFEVLARAA
ncbi:MAG TPA: iron-containing alcohol dehydrogenase [Propionibacteriaceae bacterium]|nr:iron-containing alcohol dehydrogenase [Propionibacteriaceae bacterium]